MSFSLERRQEILLAQWSAGTLVDSQDLNSTALGRVPSASFEFGERDTKLS